MVPRDEGTATHSGETSATLIRPDHRTLRGMRAQEESLRTNEVAPRERTSKVFKDRAHRSGTSLYVCAYVHISTPSVRLTLPHVSVCEAGTRSWEHRRPVLR